MCLIEDPATKRLQPRNYLETLEERVALLETTLRQVAPNLDLDSLSLNGANLPIVDSIYSTPTPRFRNPGDGQQVPFQPLDENDGINDLASKVGILSLNASGAEPRYLGSSSAFAFSRLIKPLLHQAAIQSPGSSALQERYNWSSLAPCPFPDYNTAVKLSNAYFQHIHSQYPFLHEPTFRKWEDALVQDSEGSGTMGFENTALYFLNIVCQAPSRLQFSANGPRYMPLVRYLCQTLDIQQK